ncbi:MAG: biopolymer transporter ExbD [Bacteroidales bacterium]|nr:biopolymer transporter ExbD [Bacteroidales bacterium]
MARPVKEINAGSMADIAFLLLIFFLMVTTMDVEAGLQRRLPPMPDENQKQDDVQINRRNILVVRLNDYDRLFAGGEMMDVSQLKDKAKEFLANPANDINLPEREDKVIEGFGNFAVSKGVISLQNTRGTSYKAYIEVQNELVKAINEIRDDFAMLNFGRKYAALDEDRQRIVRDAVPQNISEAEPKDTGSNKR